jgi:hypothetical protein
MCVLKEVTSLEPLGMFNTVIKLENIVFEEHLFKQMPV